MSTTLEESVHEETAAPQASNTNSENPNPENPGAEIARLVEAVLKKGTPMYIVRGLKKEHMDALYVVGYNLYSEAKYEDAAKIFQALTFYNHLDRRGWLGAAACAEMLKSYDTALVGYSFAAMLDIDDPTSALHAFDCHIALKNYPQALSALEAVILLSGEKPEYAAIKQRALGMRDALEETITSEVK